MRDFLRAPLASNGLNLATSMCEAMLDGRPAPLAGKWFYAVHQGPRSNNLLTGDASTFGVQVTITGRANEPFDRLGTDHVELVSGLDDRADAVWNAVFRNQWGVTPPGVMNIANTYLPASSYPWVEALYPTGMTVAEPVRADWFSSSDELQGRGKGNAYAGASLPFVGLKIVVSFGGAVRAQNLNDAGP